MFVSSINNETNEHIVEFQIEKFLDDDSTPNLIASPKIICVPNELAQLVLETNEGNDSLSIQVMVFKNASETSVEASILLKEKGQVVMSSSNSIRV